MNEEQEIRQCIANFYYFAMKYLKIVHPKKGLIDFNLYEYQNRLYHHLEENQFSLVNKFRQGGFTTFYTAYALWKAMFVKDQSILFLFKTDHEAISICKIIKIIIDQLPEWLKPKLSKSTDHQKFFADTGSKILFLTWHACCGVAADWLIAEEAAFIENVESNWKALYPIISTGGNCVVSSTPNKIGNWFHKTYLDAKAGLNKFAIFEPSWKENPEFNNVEWVVNMMKNLGEKGWRHEVQAEFVD